MEPFSRHHGWDKGTPIDRYYIENYLEKFKHSITGNVAEIGERKYTTQFGNNYKSDILSYYKGTEDTIVCNLETGENVPKNKYDCIILTQTLSSIFDIHSAVKNLHKALKYNGKIIVTVPFINPISLWDDSQWGDYWRFTDKSLQKLFEVNHFKTLDINTGGNFDIAKSFLSGEILENNGFLNLDIVDRQYAIIIMGVFLNNT